MKNPASLLFLVSALAVAADQPEGPRPERGPEPRGERRPEGLPQGNQPTVIPLPHGLPPGVYMLVPLPSQPGQPQPRQDQPAGRVQAPERREGDRPNLARANGERANVDRPTAQREGQGNVVRPAAMLTPDEQAKLRAAMEKANQEATVKEARESAQKAQKALEEARLNERKVTEAAALKADPSLEPLFDKIHQAQRNQQPVRRADGTGEPTRAPRGEQPAR
jgi:hypothetical protein